jgi:hypothetical protein
MKALAKTAMYQTQLKLENSKKKTLILGYGCLGTTHETMLKGFNGLMLRNDKWN